MSCISQTCCRVLFYVYIQPFSSIRSAAAKYVQLSLNAVQLSLNMPSIGLASSVRSRHSADWRRRRLDIALLCRLIFLRFHFTRVMTAPRRSSSGYLCRDAKTNLCFFSHRQGEGRCLFAGRTRELILLINL